MQPFDRDFATFCLMAFVVVAFVGMGAVSVAMCAAHFDAIVAGKFRCDPDDKIEKIMLAVLATVALGRGTLPPKV